jgi:hypothetical protein
VIVRPRGGAVLTRSTSALRVVACPAVITVLSADRTTFSTAGELFTA